MGSDSGRDWQEPDATAAASPKNPLVDRWLLKHEDDRQSRWGEGQPGIDPPHYESEQPVPAVETILIEALEPRQNRKRGDDLKAAEYLQHEDPEITKKKLKDTLASVLDKP